MGRMLSLFGYDHGSVITCALQPLAVNGKSAAFTDSTIRVDMRS
jgi:hypothetical protein